MRQGGHFLWRHDRLDILDFECFFLRCNSTDRLYLYFEYLAGRTSPVPFSIHHSPKLPRSISPWTKKSKGIGLDSDKALLISCESWYRFHVDGIMNFCDGSGYCVWVVNRTGCEGPPFDVEAMAVMIKSSCGSEFAQFLSSKHLRG